MLNQGNTEHRLSRLRYHGDMLHYSGSQLCPRSGCDSSIVARAPGSKYHLGRAQDVCPRQQHLPGAARVRESAALTAGN